MKANWPRAVAGGGRCLTSPCPPLPTHYSCRSCHHQVLINGHRQGPCCLMTLSGRKFQKRKENQSFVQNSQAAVAAPAAAKPVPVSLPALASIEDLSWSPCVCSCTYCSHPQHCHACHFCLQGQWRASGTLASAILNLSCRCWSGCGYWLWCPPRYRGR